VKNPIQRPSSQLVNTKKTKIMVMDRNSTGGEFATGGQKIEEVKQFEYLGSLINNMSDSTMELKRRLAIARTTTENMANIWKSREVTMTTELKYDCYVQPKNTLVQLCLPLPPMGVNELESGATTKNDRKRVDAFEM
jgi:hypothetical protein